MPQGLIEEGVTKIGIIRVDLAAASALQGLLAGIYEGEATFPVDVPVPAGTTDYTQFILAAEEAGAEGVALAVGEQEGLQVVRAGQQLGTDLLIGSSLSTLGHATVAELGDFADQVVFLHSYPPATYDLPVYEALRADLAASGEEALQPENLQATAMRSWIGLYALLKMIRDAKMTEFTREGVSAMLNAAKDVPMLGHVRRRGLDAIAQPPGRLPAGRHQPPGTSGDGTPRRRRRAVSTGTSSRGRRSTSTRSCAGRPIGAPEPC